MAATPKPSIVSPASESVHLHETDDGTFVATVSEARWNLVRDGEIFMWGAGDLHLTSDVFLSDRYELTVGESVDLGDDAQSYTLRHPDETYAGYSVGHVSQKMVSHASPDITAHERDGEGEASLTPAEAD
jgi:hypothetical protein